MKKNLLFIIFTFILISSFAQTHKIIIFCKITDAGYAEYIGRDKFFPDSIKATVAIQYKKSIKIRRNPDEVLLLMSLDGWKLVNEFHAAINDFSNVVYMITKEIYLDDAAYNVYIEKLKGNK